MFVSDESVAPATVQMMPQAEFHLLWGGDTVVQSGTRHRWRNDGDKPARLALFICGASRAAVPAS